MARRDEDDGRVHIGSKSYPPQSLLQLAGDVVPFPGPRLPQIPRPGAPAAPPAHLPMQLEPGSWEQYLNRDRSNPLGLGRGIYEPR